MNADELRSIQTPLKEQYRQTPGTAMITLRAQGRLGDGVSCKIETGKGQVTAGFAPPAVLKLERVFRRYAPRSTLSRAGVTLNATSLRGWHHAARRHFTSGRRSRRSRHIGSLKRSTGRLSEYPPADCSGHRCTARPHRYAITFNRAAHVRGVADSGSGVLRSCRSKLSPSVRDWVTLDASCCSESPWSPPTSPGGPVPVQINAHQSAWSLPRWKSTPTRKD